jgi:hypothetical protein
VVLWRRGVSTAAPLEARAEPGGPRAPAVPSLIFATRRVSQASWGRWGSCPAPSAGCYSVCIHTGTTPMLCRRARSAPSWATTVLIRATTSRKHILSLNRVVEASEEVLRVVLGHCDVVEWNTQLLAQCGLQLLRLRDEVPVNAGEDNRRATQAAEFSCQGRML